MYIVLAGGSIRKSTDYGVNWVTVTGPSTKTYNSICCSGDGTKVFYAAYDGYIFISTDSGANWAQKETLRKWSTCVCSNDFMKIYVNVDLGGGVYVSLDYGVTWAIRGSLTSCNHLACSGDGSVVATGVTSGNFYISTDSGVNWVSQAAIGTGLWRACSVSDDGQTIAAAIMDGGLYALTKARPLGSSPTPAMILTETNDANGIKVTIPTFTQAPNTALTLEWTLPYLSSSIYVLEFPSADRISNWTTNGVTWSFPAGESKLKMVRAAIPASDSNVDGFVFYRRAVNTINWGFLSSTRKVIPIVSLGYTADMKWWTTNSFNRQVTGGSYTYSSDVTGSYATLTSSMTAELTANSVFTLEGMIDFDLTSLESMPVMSKPGWRDSACETDQKMIYRPKLASVNLVCNPINSHEIMNPASVPLYSGTQVLQPSTTTRNFQLYFSHLFRDAQNTMYIDLSSLECPAFTCRSIVHNVGRTWILPVEGKLDFGLNLTAYDPTYMTRMPTKFVNCIMRSSNDPDAVIFSSSTTYGFYYIRFYNQYKPTSLTSFL